MRVRRRTKGLRGDKADAANSPGMGLPIGVQRVGVALEPGFLTDKQERVRAVPRAAMEDVGPEQG